MFKTFVDCIDDPLKLLFNDQMKFNTIQFYLHSEKIEFQSHFRKTFQD